MIWEKHKKAIRGFGVFLLLMGVCYLVSKGIYANALPRVSTKGISEGTITRQLEGTGFVRQGQEFGVYVPAGLRVETVYAHVGQELQEGTPLFLLDIEDLQRIIAEREIEIAGLEEQLGGDRDTVGSERDAEVSLLRAQEDYDLAVQNADREIAGRRAALAEAKTALEDFQKKNEDAIRTVSGSDAGMQTASYESALQSLKQAVRNAEEALDGAVLAADRGLLQSSRNVEDARRALEDAKNASPDMSAVERNLLYRQELLEELKRLLEEEGVVTAPEPGILTAVQLAVGERTSDGAGIVYARKEDEKELEIYLSGGAEKYVRAGDEAELSYMDQKGEHTLVRQVDAVQSAEGYGVAVFHLDASVFSMGQTVQMHLAKKSGRYSVCIPAQAIYLREDVYGYVFVLEESEGFFGKEYVVREVDVRVLDTNGRVTALEEGALEPGDLVVVSTDKELKDGDVVRVD